VSLYWIVSKTGLRRYLSGRRRLNTGIRESGARQKRDGGWQR
jgi:hypothetical protein